MKALLIENSRLYHTFLSEHFAALGYQSVLADSRCSALKCLQRESFQIICMNMYFEGANAIDFIKEIRSYDASVAVIVLTSNKSKSQRLRALRAGVTEVIYKTRPHEMVSVISGCIKHGQNAGLRGRRVLYVEDSKTQAAIVTKILESMELSVTHFKDAEDAMACFENDDFDLVITDVLLKGRASGLALVRYIRSLSGLTQRIPVLTVTGYDDPARRQELFRAGTSDYIAKPVLKEELVIRVTNLISNKLLADKVAGQQAQLYEMAVRDQLTGCYNRHGFNELADAYMKQVQNKPEAMSFLVLDLDLFKTVNDTYGHDAGDKVLTAIGKLLMFECGSDDLVARYGGEEFVILLTHCKKSAAMGISERLCKEVQALRPEGILVTISIGLTSVTEKEEPDLDKMFKIADQAVYRAKSRGRNCVSFCSYT